jgi:hypothetical protein
MLDFSMHQHHVFQILLFLLLQSLTNSDRRNQSCDVKHNLQYLTNILHPSDQNEDELTEILIENSMYALAFNDINAAEFLATKALHVGANNHTLTLVASEILERVTDAIKQAKQVKHRNLFDAINDALVLQNVGNIDQIATKEAAKALNRAFKLWKTSKIKRMIKRRNGLDDNRKWFKYTTVLFRMLFNEWRLEDANSIGNDAIQIGLMLLSSSRRETVHSYTPVEDRQLLNILHHDTSIDHDHVVNLGLHALIQTILGDDDDDRVGVRASKELKNTLNNLYFMDAGEKSLMDKSCIRNNWGNYVTKLFQDSGRNGNSSSTTEYQPHHQQHMYPEVTSTSPINNLLKCRRIIASKINYNSSDIIRVDARDITKEEFKKTYLNNGQPVILTHYIEHIESNIKKSSSSSTTTSSWKTTWDVEHLVKKYPRSHVLVTRSSSVATRQYLHYAVPMALSTTETLEYYYKNINNDKYYINCDPPYLFAKLTFEARNSNNFNLNKLTEDYFDVNRFKFDLDERSNNALFYIGSEMSGAYFHTHTNAVNVLFKGRKLWYLMPPKLHYGPTIFSLNEWIKQVKPTLKYKPLEIIQKQGEMLFVPTFWSHATLNLEETMGVAIEIGVDVRLKTEF